MYPEWYPEEPGSDADRDRTRSPFGENNFRMNALQEKTGSYYSDDENERAKYDFPRSSTREFEGGYTQKRDILLYGAPLLFAIFSTDPGDSLEGFSVFEEIEDGLDMSTSSSADDYDPLF